MFPWYCKLENVMQVLSGDGLVINTLPYHQSSWATVFLATLSGHKHMDESVSFPKP